jgi:hypothetical protein
MILHDDDFFVPGGLGRLVDGLAELRGQYPVVLFGVKVVDDQERVMKRQIFRQDDYLSPHDALTQLFSNSSFVRFPAIAIQRDVFGQVGYFNPDCKEPCDLEMWMRLFAKHGVYCCRSVTVAYRVHSQALTMGSFHGDTVRILLALFERLSELGMLTEREVERCKGLFFHSVCVGGGLATVAAGTLAGVSAGDGIIRVAGT